MMYKDHREPKNSMYGTQNKLDGFSSFSLQEYGRLEKIRFNRTQPKIHVSADAEKSHHISHISKYVRKFTEYTQSYPTISLPPNISNYILQYPYSISIVSQNIPILSPKYPISKVSYMNYFMLLPNFSQNLLFFTPGKLSFRSPTMTAAWHRAASARPL